MKTATRTLTAVALVLALHAASKYAGTMGMPAKVSIPPGDFHGLPLQLGDWSGGESDVDPQFASLGGTCAAIHRIYHNAAGAAVVFYAAVFDDVEVPVPPHPPGACYTAAGHRIAASRDVKLSGGKEGEFLAQVLSLEKDGHNSTVLFWYQVPGATYVDGYAQRRLFWSYRGQPTWPAVVKVMLESRNPNLDRAADELKDLAPHAYEWIRQYQEAGQK